MSVFQARRLYFINEAREGKREAGDCEGKGHPISQELTRSGLAAGI